MRDEYAFGEWLLDEMEKRNITKTELARMTGLSTATITYYTSFQRFPTLKILLLILGALGKRIEIVNN